LNFLKGFHIKKNNKEEEIPLGSIKTNEKELLFDLFIHDLNEPLSIVATSANNLAQKEDRYGPLADSQKRLLNRILRNIKRAQNLVQEMIEILRSEEGLFKGEFFSVKKALNGSLLEVLEMSVPNAVEGLYQVENQEAFQGGLKEHGIFIEITGKYYKAPFYHDHGLL
jgi:signal transduction histidine kinase